VQKKQKAGLSKQYRSAPKLGTLSTLGYVPHSSAIYKNISKQNKTTQRFISVTGSGMLTKWQNSAHFRQPRSSHILCVVNYFDQDQRDSNSTGCIKLFTLTNLMNKSRVISVPLVTAYSTK